MEIAWKMDVENTTLCADWSVYARSVDSKNHWSRDALTSIWKAKGRTATHSIEYKGLYTLYPCIAIIDNSNMVYSQRELSVLSQLDCELLAEVGIAPVITNLGEIEGDHPHAFVLDHHALKRIDQRKEIVTEYTNSEGFVLRNALPFHISEYSSNVVKWVRAGHMQTDKHRTYSSTKRNQLELDSNGKPPKLSAKDWLG